MPLDDAATVKSVADSRNAAHNYDSSIMAFIKAEIDRVKMIPEYVAAFNFPYAKNVVEQPDASTIDCDTLVASLKAKNYTVSHLVKYDRVIIHLRF